MYPESGDTAQHSAGHSDSGLAVPVSSFLMLRLIAFHLSTIGFRHPAIEIEPDKPAEFQRKPSAMS
jgi:hypothetical protein